MVLRKNFFKSKTYSKQCKNNDKWEKICNFYHKGLTCQIYKERLKIEKTKPVTWWVNGLGK